MNTLLSEIFLFWFSTVCDLRLASYSPKHAPWCLSNVPFCVYFKYNSKTTGCLQLYYTPNDSSTTEDALFHVKSCKTVATYKLWPRANIVLSCYFVHKYEWQQKSGRLRLIIHQTTAFLPRLHLLEVQSMVCLTSCHSTTFTVSLHYMYIHVSYIN